MSDKPTHAISLKPTWAWLAVHGYKPIENRGWPTLRRGRVYVHAGNSLTRAQYNEHVAKVKRIDPSIKLPPMDELPRGGIVGAVTVADCVKDHPSPWFRGPFGHVFTDPTPLPFRKMRGTLFYFPI